MKGMVVIAIALLLPGSAFAAETVEEVVAGYVAARGGDSGPPATVKRTGVLTMLGLEFPVWEGVAQSEGHAVFGYYSAYGQTFHEFKGGAPQRWVVFPTWESERLPLEGLFADLLALLPKLDEPLLNRRRSKGQLRLMGREMLGEEEVYELELNVADGGKRWYYVDVESYELRRVGFETSLLERDGRADLDLGDYRSIDGIPISHFSKLHFSGYPLLEIAWRRVEVAPEDPFSPPAPSKDSSDQSRCQLANHVSEELGFSIDYCTEHDLGAHRLPGSLFSASSPDFFPRFDVGQLELPEEPTLEALSERFLTVFTSLGQGEAKITTLKSTTLRDGVTPAMEMRVDWSLHGLPLNTLLLSTTYKGNNYQVFYTADEPINEADVAIAYSLELLGSEVRETVAKPE